MPFPFDNVQTIGILSSRTSRRGRGRLPIVPKQDKQDPPPPPPPPDEWGEYQQYLDSIRHSGRWGSRGNFILDPPTLDPVSTADPRFPDINGVNVTNPNYNLLNPFGNDPNPPDNVDWDAWFDNMQEHTNELIDGMIGTSFFDIPWTPSVDPPEEKESNEPIVKDIRAHGRPDWLPKPEDAPCKKCEYKNLPHQKYKEGGLIEFESKYGPGRVYLRVQNSQGKWVENPQLKELGISIGSDGSCTCTKNFQLPPLLGDLSGRFPAQDAVRTNIYTLENEFDYLWERVLGVLEARGAELEDAYTEDLGDELNRLLQTFLKYLLSFPAPGSQIMTYKIAGETITIFINGESIDKDDLTQQQVFVISGLISSLQQIVDDLVLFMAKWGYDSQIQDSINRYLKWISYFKSLR